MSCLFKLCVEELSVRIVQHHSRQGMITVLVILLTGWLLIFVHELRAKHAHKAIPPGRTVSKMMPLKAC